MCIRSPSKSTPQSRELDVNFFQWHSKPGSYCSFCELRLLQWARQLGLICCHMGKEVHRFHAVVSKEWGGVSALNHFGCILKCCVRISVLACNFSRLRH